MKLTESRKRELAYEEMFIQRANKYMPLMVRIDGMAFHTLTANFEPYFDKVFRGAMKSTMKALCETAQGCVFGYTQSDEITLVLCGYFNDRAEPWLNYRVDKITSKLASVATQQFERNFRKNVEEYKEAESNRLRALGIDGVAKLNEVDAQVKKYLKAIDKLEGFHVKVWNKPKDKVIENLIDRQEDAAKNSVSSLARTMYTQGELNKLNSKAMQDKMFTEKGVNWNDTPTEARRGAACIKQPIEVEPGLIRKKWVIDTEIPIFSKNPEYITALLEPPLEEEIEDKKKKGKKDK